MKKGLIILLASIILIGLGPSLAISEKSQPKIYTLEEFLDSIYVYEEDLGRELKKLYLEKPLAGKNALIEHSFFPHELKIGRYSDGMSLILELFNASCSFKNKEGTKTYSVPEVTIRAPLEITPEKLKQCEFTDLQNKLLTAVIDNKLVKVRGYIYNEGWIETISRNRNRFLAITFFFRILEIQ